MSDLSRRKFLQASAGVAALGAAVALPVSSSAVAFAAPTRRDDTGGVPSYDGPVIVHIRDASTGEVSVLAGTNEVIYQDRQLVAQVLRAAGHVGK